MQHSPVLRSGVTEVQVLARDWTVRLVTRPASIIPTTRFDVIRITRMFDEFIHITYVSFSSSQDLHDLQYYRTLHAYVHVCP